MTGAWHDGPSEAEPAARRPPDWPFSPARAKRWRSPARVVAAVALLLAAVGLFAFGALRPRHHEARPAPPGPQRLAEFSLPAGWADRTAQLAPRVKGVRPEYVFQGPVTDGFAADLNIVRQPRNPQDPPLPRLVDLVAARVAGQLHTKVTGRRPLTVGGEPAIAYDYRYRSRGRVLRARQVTVMYGQSVVFANLTVVDRSFARDAAALRRLIASWRWR